MTYSNDFLEQIRAACPMETIAGNYVNLIRRGRHYVCNCPFHSEKSPSCTIFPETQSFYCFGCGAGGDVITWVRRMDNLEFTDAVKQLAERCGLQVPTDREADRRAYLRTRVFAVNRETANFYFRNLISGSDKRGLQYFISRQLKPETIKKYGLGYASDSWNALTDYLLQKGFTEEELLLAVPSRLASILSLPDSSSGSLPVCDLTILKEEPFVLIQKKSTARDLVDSLFETAGFAPQILFETANNQTILSMIRAEICCGILPAYYVDHTRRDVTYYRLPSHPVWNITAACRKDAYITKAAKEFISLAADYFNCI